MDRRDFLGRVRAAVATADLPDAPQSAPGGLVGELGAASLLDRFVERATEVDAQVSVVDSTEVPELVLDLVRGYDTKTFISWADDQLPVGGVSASLIAAGCTPQPSEVPTEPADRIVYQERYFDLVVGITGADGALAESGSIILQHGPKRPRMASLVPLVHIALVPVSQLVASLSHWIADNPDAATASPNLLVITGPSRTGDIEMSLTLGVHGPRHLHILVLSDK